MRITIDNVCLVLVVAAHLGLAALLHQKTQERITPPQIAYAELIQAPSSDKPAQQTAAPTPKPKVEARKAETKPAPSPKRVVEKQTPLLRTQNSEFEHTVKADEPIEPAPQAVAAPAADPTPPSTSSTASSQTSAAGSTASNDVKETAPLFNAAYLSNPKPSYPRISQELEEEGRVLLRVTVSTGGDPISITLAKGSGFSRLDRAAQETVKRWRFVPAKRGEQAVVGSVLVPIDFKLRENS